MKRSLAIICSSLGCLAMLLSCNDDVDANSISNEVVTNVAELAFDSDGGDRNINISTSINSVWGIESDADWITFLNTDGSEVTSGVSNGSVIARAGENGIPSQRTATVRVFTSSNEINLPVTQAAGPILALPPDASEMGDFSSVQLTAEMGTGINIGNTLEAICTETAWGNPLINQEFINGLAEAGFKTVRIPVAWSCYFSDEASYKIDNTIFDRVAEVIDMVINAGMIAKINIHWDGGWLNEPTYEKQGELNERLASMWQQIAIRFRDYDYRLLFAGTNEVLFEGDFSEPTEEYVEVQNSFNQTFINTVRATGGRNAYRYLVVQAFNTNIDWAVEYFTLPTDTVEDRMLLEVHYYDPFQFTLDESTDDIWQWGAIATDVNATAGWGDEDWLDAQFGKMKTNFVDNGMGVIIGEFAATYRAEAAGDSNLYREYYYNYLTQSALENQLVPIYWDNGPTTDHASGIFNRSNGDEVYPGLIDALTQ